MAYGESDNNVAKEQSIRKLWGNDPVRHARCSYTTTHMYFDVLEPFDVLTFKCCIVFYRDVSWCIWCILLYLLMHPSTLKLDGVVYRSWCIECINDVFAIRQLWCRSSARHIFVPRSKEPYDISLALLCSTSLRCQNRVMYVHKLALWISHILSWSIIFANFTYLMERTRLPMQTRIYIWQSDDVTILVGIVFAEWRTRCWKRMWEWDGDTCLRERDERLGIVLAGRDSGERVKELLFNLWTAFFL